MTSPPKKCADDTRAIEEQKSFIITKEYRRFANFCYSHHQLLFGLWTKKIYLA